MKFAALLITLVASASAFTSPLTARSSVSLRAAEVPEEATATPAPTSAEAYDIFSDPKYVGNSDFRGKRFDFDPLGLAAAYPPFVPWFRECELRHGRTAMIAGENCEERSDEH